MMPTATFFNLPKEKQHQVMEAAISEFSENSFEEVKISTIIKKAKVPRSSFYDYFEDKEDMYKHILSLVQAEKMKYMAPVMEREWDSFFKHFKELMKAGAAFAANHPEYEKLANKMGENKKLMAELLGDAEQNVTNIYEVMIKKGVEAGEIRPELDVEFLARSIYLLSSNLAVEGFKEENGPLDVYIEKLAEQMIDFMKRGMGNGK
jgi:AcrR family transcriptional regulator